MTTPTPDRDALLAEALRERDKYLAKVGGCTDGNCIIVKPKGMHTNGGCRCASSFVTMQRFAYASNRFADAVRALAGDRP